MIDTESRIITVLSLRPQDEETKIQSIKWLGESLCRSPAVLHPPYSVSSGWCSCFFYFIPWWDSAVAQCHPGIPQGFSVSKEVQVLWRRMRHTQLLSSHIHPVHWVLSYHLTDEETEAQRGSLPVVTRISTFPLILLKYTDITRRQRKK